MKFSEYVVLTRPIVVMDPLGFLVPYAALQDKLFKQFTVLSNHPAYHGLLALLYQSLAERDITPQQPKFSRAFRESEILWGLLNVAVDVPVLNVTKYRLLLEETNTLSLGAIGKSHPIYLRLAYGTLGHYSNPSIFWGILGKSGYRLTELGTTLGAAFDVRGNLSFRKVLSRWLAGKDIQEDELRQLGEAYSLASPPGRDECVAWRQLIKRYCDEMPHARCLWTDTLRPEELEHFNRDASAYSGFFDSLRHRYSSLTAELDLMESFQLMAGIVQFIFEREYLLGMDKTAFAIMPGPLEEQLAAELGRLAKTYVAAAYGLDAKGLFGTLASLSSYREVAAHITEHHVRHQKSKDASPFIQDGELLIRDRYKMADFGPFHAELDRQPDWPSRRALLAYRYRRDWHFGRASTYHQYAEAHR